MMSIRMARRFMVLVVFAASICAGGIVAGQPREAAAGPASIGEARAVEIALAEAGGGEVVDMKLRRKDGRAVYSLLVVNGDNRFAMRIDAASGDVVKLDRRSIERVDYPNDRHDGRTWPETAITSDRAREIALERAGGGMVVDMEKDYKRDGRVFYEVEVIDAGRKCEVEIDANTGAIVEYSEKSPRS